MSFVGKKCRSWDEGCIAESSDATIILDVASTNNGKEEREDAVWI